MNRSGLANVEARRGQADFKAIKQLKNSWSTGNWETEQNNKMVGSLKKYKPNHQICMTY